MKKVRPLPSNISKSERRALIELRKCREITILPADKGKATVVMNVSDYEDKVTEMLSDART